ncbi:MAG: hypothetical protein QM668_01025 [Agriterribacter sp.]
MNRFLLVVACGFLFIGIISCEKDNQENREPTLKLVKRTAQSGSSTFTYDETGNLSTLQYTSEGMLFKTTYHQYNKNGDIISFTTEYDKNKNDEGDPDFRCENFYDEQGRIERMNQYNLITDELISYYTIDYNSGTILCTRYRAPSERFAIEKYVLTPDGKNVSQLISYSGVSETPIGSVTYLNYDDQKNPHLLLPLGYNPNTPLLSKNNAQKAIWETKSAGAGVEIIYNYSYQYNNEGYPISFSTVGDYVNSTNTYEYEIQ